MSRGLKPFCFPENSRARSDFALLATGHVGSGAVLHNGAKARSPRTAPRKLTWSGWERVASPCPGPMEIGFLCADVIWGRVLWEAVMGTFITNKPTVGFSSQRLSWAPERSAFPTSALLKCSAQNSSTWHRSAVYDTLCRSDGRGRPWRPNEPLLLPLHTCLVQRAFKRHRRTDKRFPKKEGPTRAVLAVALWGTQRTIGIPTAQQGPFLPPVGFSVGKGIWDEGRQLKEPRARQPGAHGGPVSLLGQLPVAFGRVHTGVWAETACEGCPESHPSAQCGRHG